MKTISLYISIFVIAAVASFSSCALKKNEFAQRKYYNFPRVKHTVEKSETEYTLVKQVETLLAEPKAISGTHENKPTSEMIVASANDKGIVFERPELNTTTAGKNTAANRINTGEKDEKPVASYKKSDVIKLVRKNSRNIPASNNADGMLILMILAAIFIPPLGVYLKENSTTQWFWITLAICLVSIIAGYSIPGLFGLWFVAAIIALLVVFDAI